jgi:prepilin-type processing-associated H-X9-DG protein
MLPYMEQENVYKLINFNMPARAQPEQVRMAALPLLLSPLDPLAQQQAKLAPTSYLFCAGTKHSLEKNNGIFFKDSKLTLAVITSQDGSSNTVMTGETLIGDGGQQAKDVKRQHVKLDVMALQNLNADSGVQEFQNNRNIAGDRGHSWIEGKFLHGTFTGTRKLNDARPDVDCGGMGGLSALRCLQKGTNILFADGHAIFLSDAADFATWQALCTRDGGEVIGNLP